MAESERPQSDNFWEKRSLDEEVINLSDNRSTLYISSPEQEESKDDKFKISEMTQRSPKDLA